MAEELSERFFKLSPDDQADIIQRSNPQARERILGWLRARPKTPVSQTLQASREAASRSTFEQARPESTLASRGREAAIGVLEPLTIPNLYRTGRQLVGAGVSSLMGKQMPMMEAVTGMAESAVDPVLEYSEAVRSGDWERAAHAAGGMLSQTVPTVSGATELARGGVSAIDPESGLSLSGKLRLRTRQAVQRALGAGPKRTTRPIVEDYLKKAENVRERQVESDVNIRRQNVESREAARRKNLEGQFRYDEEVKKAREEAAKKNTEAQAKFQAEAADVTEQARRSRQIKTRSEALETGAARGSERFGEQVSQLDQDLRAEGNRKYDIVHRATANDPGIAVDDIAQAVQFAEENILKGSEESIKQFRELGGEPSPEEVRPSAIEPTTAARRALIQRLREQDTLPFDDLQGYSTELSAKLVKGNLLGDVYQAMKYVRDALDAAKRTIAERNGVGPALTEADGFWRQYMDLFYDKDSPIAKVRESVGTVDPQFYSKPIVRGEATDVARGKLYRFPSEHARRLRQLADFAKQLQQLEPGATVTLAPGEEVPLEEARKTVPTRPRALPERPEPVGPKDVQPPEPAGAPQKPLKEIKKPKAPTAEQLLEAKRRRLEGTGEQFAQLNKWDIRTVVGAVVGGIRHLSLLPEIGIPIISAEKALASGLDRPTIVARIAQLTPADLVELQRLPESVQAPLRSEILRMLEAEEQFHRLSPSARQFLGAAGVARPSANRREALDALGR